MTKWIVRRWARYGHDRLYVATPDGADLGYLDLNTGRYHSDTLADLTLLKAALAEHQGRSAQAAVPISQPVRREPYPPAPAPLSSVPTWDPYPASAAIVASAHYSAPPPGWDLSANQPGAAARECALAEREAQGRVRHWLARFVGAKTQERSWRIGADGEQAVAEQLSLLGGQWRVLHAVPVGERGSDIDHVVIGPTGVFTVNTKNHPHASVWVGGNTFMVNGQRVPYIRNSRHEARRAARLLSEQVGFPVDAVGVVAVVGARRGLTVKRQPVDGRVVVVPRRRISRYLAGLPARFNAREVEAVFQVARRSTTWRP
ncbi:nuclease-related domain-containing protein [Pseudactinotalea sp. Z1748]|uniref:nuclease-related domain-containing protein n=1 Tax=Pseudactinotalea sp. Z1748 TaxID=3413027 RepID=UPI003C797746